MTEEGATYRMFTTLADSVNEVIFISSIRPNSKVNLIKYCNSAFCKFFNVIPAECKEVDMFSVLNILNDTEKNKLENLILNTDIVEGIDLFVGIQPNQRVWINFSFNSFIEDNIRYILWKQNDYVTDKGFQHELISLNNNTYNLQIKIEDGLDPICFVDFKGKLLFANRFLLRDLEYDAKELLNIGIIEVHAKDNIDIAIEAFYSTRQGIHQQYDVILISKSGNQLYYSVSSYPFYVNGEIAGVYYYGKETTIAEINNSVERLTSEINNFLLQEKSLLHKMTQVVTLLSKFTEYECVECWMPDKSFSKSSLFAYYYPDEPVFKEFYSISSTLQLNLNEDDVFVTKKGHEISRKVTNLFLDSNFPRKKWAENAGLTEGFSFPVFLENQLVANFTFFSKKKLLNFYAKIHLIKLVTNKIAISIQYIKQKNELNEIFNLSPDFLFTLDITGKFVNVNNSFINSLNVNKSDLIGKSFVSFVNDATYDLINDKLVEVKKSKVVSFESEFRKPNQLQSSIWIQWSMSLDADEAIIYGAGKDITQRKEYVEKLRESNERYTLLSKATNDVIYEFDIKNDVIYWQESFTKIFGHKLPILTFDYSYWSSFLHPSDKNRITGNLSSAKMNGETYYTSEYRFRTAEGNYKNILDRSILVYNEKNELIKMVGTMQDITELKESESALEHLNNALQQRARQLQDLNKELEQFAYIVSHDLQEPLRMISSFMQLLLSEKESSKTEKSELYINFAIDGANRMKRLIQDLLTYSRVGATEEDFVEIDCNAVLKETLQVYNQRIIDLKAQIIVSPLPKIKAIHSLIGQVFDNLVSNALKYNDKSNPILEISYEESATHFILKFKDNGIGIDARYIDLIYVPFKRLHNAKEYSGTGIGLAVVKKIADKHHGQLWLDSQPKIGTTFYISFKK